MKEIVFYEPGSKLVAVEYLHVAKENDLCLTILTTKKEKFNGLANIIYLDKEKTSSELITYLKSKLDADFTIFTESEEYIPFIQEIYKEKTYNGFGDIFLFDPRNKKELKKILLKNDLNTPRYLVLKSGSDLSKLEEKIEYPLIVKPVAGLGSVGVKKVESEKELKKALRSVEIVNRLGLSNFGDYNETLIEEYISGDEFAIDSIWSDGELQSQFILNRNKMCGNEFPDSLYYYDPELNDQIKEKLLETTRKIGEVLGVKNGCLHVEILLQLKNDSLKEYIIDVGTRAGAGGLFYYLFSKVEYKNIFEVALLSKIGQKKDCFPKDIKKNQNIIAFYQPQFKQSGTFSYFKNIEKLNKNKVTPYPFLQKGDYFSSAMCMNYSIWLLIDVVSNEELSKQIKNIDDNLDLILDN